MAKGKDAMNIHLLVRHWDLGFKLLREMALEPGAQSYLWAQLAWVICYVSVLSPIK